VPSERKEKLIDGYEKGAIKMNIQLSWDIKCY